MGGKGWGSEGHLPRVLVGSEALEECSTLLGAQAGHLSFSPASFTRRFMGWESALASPYVRKQSHRTIRSPY